MSICYIYNVSTTFCLLSLSAVHWILPQELLQWMFFDPFTDESYATSVGHAIQLSPIIYWTYYWVFPATSLH